MSLGFHNPAYRRPLNVIAFPLLVMEHTQMCTDVIIHENVTYAHIYDIYYT